MSDTKIGDGVTIFILDDEKDICHFVKEFFTRRGFEVYTTSSGKVAVNPGFCNRGQDFYLID